MLRYVYGIAPVGAASAIEGAAIDGIDGSRVRTIADGDLAAIVSDLPEMTWTDESLNELVGDLEWLAPRAASHQQVNARALDVAGALIPLSFGTLYRDDDRVREMLRDDRATRLARLGELRGKGEWVITITRGANETPGMTADLIALDREIASSDPGRAYLLEKRRASVASAAASRADDDAARRAYEALAAVGERVYREPVTRGGPDVVALRLSLLAPREDGTVARMIEEVAGTLERDGYHVRSSGPWPAYRFGSLP